MLMLRARSDVSVDVTARVLTDRPEIDLRHRGDDNKTGHSVLPAVMDVRKMDLAVSAIRDMERERVS